jgi:hypothetical protein
VEATAQKSAADVRRVGDVLVLSASGIYSPARHAEVRLLAWTELQRLPARAVVLDMLGALTLLSEAQRDAMVLNSLGDPQAITVPIGVVVPEPLFSATVRQCSFAWSHGRMWVAFLDLADALDWASSQKRLPVAAPPRAPA